MDEKRLRTLDEQIAEALREAHERGELQAAKDYGKPLDFGDGYDETPAELRMAFKVLKDAGYTPPEVEMLHELARMRKALESLDAGSDEAARLRGKIHEAALAVSLRLERLARAKP